VSLLNLAITRPWNVRTPFLYRFMDQQYLDEFFATGRLRLSGFSKFKQSPDEQLGDRWERWNMLVGTAVDKTVIGIVEYGRNAYVLCASALHHEDLYEAFHANSCFRINDSLNFGAAIAAAISNFQSGIEGPCSYQEERWIER
jgi:hypothetical protein